MTIKLKQCKDCKFFDAVKSEGIGFCSYPLPLLPVWIDTDNEGWRDREGRRIILAETAICKTWTTKEARP